MKKKVMPKTAEDASPDAMRRETLSIMAQLLPADRALLLKVAKSLAERA